MKKFVLALCLVVTAQYYSQCGMNITPSFTPVACYGNANGSASVSVSGGMPSYTYSWNGSSSTSSIATNLVAGTYTCYVTDASLCTDSVVIYVTQPPQLILLFNVAPGCVNSGGTICATTGGGSAPFAYMWSNGATGSCIYSAPSGTYSCTVCDAGGCCITDTVSINNNFPSPVIDSIHSTGGNILTSCASCTNLVPYVTGGGGGYTFNWSGGCGNFAGAILAVCPSVFPCASTVTVVDANGCYASALKTIYGPPNQISNITGSVKNDSCNLCVGAFYNITPVNGANPISWSWTGPYSFSSSQQNVSNICGGTYTVTATDANSCTYTKTFSSGNALNAYLSVGGSNPNCANTCTGTAIVNYTGPNAPYTYVWNSSPPQMTAAATGLCPGTYTCTVTDNAGCMATIAKTVSAIVQSPNLNPSLVVQPGCGLCNGAIYLPFTSQYTVTTTGPSGYTSTSFNQTNLCSGTYTITATRTGCTTHTNTVTLTLLSGSIAGLTVSPAVVPESCAGMHDGSIVLSLSGGTPPFTFLWSNGITTQNLSNLVAGNYSLKISDGSGNCHLLSASVPLTSTSCAYINGNVFADLNNDCVNNLADYGISSSMVKAVPGNFYAYTNASGNYTMLLPPGNYSVQHFTNQQGYLPTCNLTQTANLATPGSTASNVDFSDSLNPIPDLGINYVFATQAVPGFTQSIQLSVSNTSVFYGTPLNGIVKLVLSPDQYFNSATPAPSVISGDTLFWTFTGLNAFSSQTYSVNVTVAANPSLIGTTFHDCASVVCTNASELYLWNNNSCNSQYVTGAFDPNMKEVNPLGLNSTGDILLADSVFTYTVHFQNTGNGPAHDVVVLDSISSKLNLETFELLGSSHPCSIDFLAGDVARFSFLNIMLPDSNSNEPASHGWFKYRIKKKASTTWGDQVLNTAHIYFDFNPAIVTNTTVNTYAFYLTNIKTQGLSRQINLYPNPASGVLYLRESNGEKIEQIEIMDALGKTILQKNVSHNLVLLDISTIPTGVYFVRVRLASTMQMTKKLIISR